MGEAAAMMRTWRVGRRKVTMTAPQVRIGQVGMATIEWYWRKSTGPQRCFCGLPFLCVSALYIS